MIGESPAPSRIHATLHHTRPAPTSGHHPVTPTPQATQIKKMRDTGQSQKAICIPLFGAIQSRAVPAGPQSSQIGGTMLVLPKLHLIPRK